MGPFATLLIMLESPQQGDVFGGHFTNFGPIEQKLLNLQ
jgi:hypothetical protein